MDRRTEIQNIISKYNTAKYIQEDRNRYDANIRFLSEGIVKLKECIFNTEKVLRRIQGGILSYKTERLKLLELEMTKNLNQVFPNRDFVTEFSPEMYRGSEVLELLAGEGKRLAPTKMQNGRLFRQIINVSGSTMIQVLSGCKLIIFDEATNSGDAESLEEVSEIFKYLLELGYQIIIIEHKHEVYNSLPRLQYNLAYDESEKRAKVVSKNVYG